ncbi:MAG: PA0069 family radical SAM protein [Woeseia sp.]
MTARGSDDLAQQTPVQMSVYTSVYKGRGAVSNPSGRFASAVVLPSADEAGEQPAPTTTLRPMSAGRIISRNESPDVPFDRSINPYMGCEHGCIYCYARPSHSYLDLSPGIDFETKIFYKPNAVARLLEEWQKPGYECRPITIGANTDPYQPAEKKLRLTRQLLEVFLKHRHPVSLISKGTLMRRDIDLLSELAAQGLCSVALSVPTADDDLKRRLEPRVPSATARFALMQALSARGIPVSLLMAPIIPAINDREIEYIVRRAGECGAQHASYVLLRLPHELKTLFSDWLAAHCPERAAHVMSLLRQASGGRDYDNRFGSRQTGRGAYAEMLGQRFSVACRKAGLEQGRQQIRPLDCSQFDPPGKRQLTMDFSTVA